MHTEINCRTNTKPFYVWTLLISSSTVTMLMQCMTVFDSISMILLNDLWESTLSTLFFFPHKVRVKKIKLIDLIFPSSLGLHKNEHKIQRILISSHPPPTPFPCYYLALMWYICYNWWAIIDTLLTKVIDRNLLLALYILYIKENV